VTKGSARTWMVGAFPPVPEYKEKRKIMGMFEYGEFRNHRLGRTIPVYVTQYRTSAYDQWADYQEYREDDDVQGDAQRLREEGKEVRTITRRIPNPDFGRFRVGTYVKIHPSTTRFAQGFRYGRVTRIGFTHITVVWSGSEEVKSKFIPEFLAPQLEEGEED
jgi:hypothetical protein